MFMNLNHFSKLKHIEMRAYLKDNQIPFKGKTKKDQFIELYAAYLATIPYQQKLQRFSNCGDSDIKCMLFALGMSEDKYHSLLMLNCDRICTQKQQKTATPLAVVVDPSRHVAVGVQAPEGIVPITETSVPHNKPVIPIINPKLLQEIQQSSKQSKRLLKVVPALSNVTLKPLSDKSLLMGLKKMKLKPVRDRDDIAGPGPKPSPDTFSLLKETLANDIRSSVIGDDESSDDDDEYGDDWD